MAARKAPPDVVVIDAAMPLLKDLEATCQMAMLIPSARALRLARYGDEECVERGALGTVFAEPPDSG